MIPGDRYFIELKRGGEGKKLLNVVFTKFQTK
jgi:hypothetical protein